MLQSTDVRTGGGPKQKNAIKLWFLNQLVYILLKFLEGSLYAGVGRTLYRVSPEQNDGQSRLETLTFRSFVGGR